MKKLAYLTSLAMCSAVGAFAQGTLNFDNSPLSTGGAVDAPVFDVNGTTKLTGPTFQAQLWAGPSAGSLAAVGSAVTFYTSGSGGEGYVFPSGSTVIIPTVAPGAAAFVQLRAWLGGTSWGAAANTKQGNSATISVTTGGSGSPPSQAANLVGLASFSLTNVVPEPSTIVLGVLGAAALLFRRKRSA